MPSLLRGFREQHRSAVMEFSIKFFHQCRQRKLQINFEVVKKIHTSFFWNAFNSGNATLYRQISNVQLCRAICAFLCFLTLTGYSWAYGTPDTTGSSIPVVQWVISVSGRWHIVLGKLGLDLIPHWNCGCCVSKRISSIAPNRTMSGIMILG